MHHNWYIVMHIICIRESVFAPKTNLKTCAFCCCFRRSRMRMTSLPIQLSWWMAQWGNIVPSFPRGSLLERASPSIELDSLRKNCLRLFQIVSVALNCIFAVKIPVFTHMCGSKHVCVCVFCLSAFDKHCLIIYKIYRSNHESTNFCWFHT